MARGLAELGHHVTAVRPRPRPFLPDPGSLSRRLGFNLLLPLRLEPAAFDLVVGFDLDGCLLPRGSTPVVVCLKGVAADEARFEAGWGRIDRLVAASLEGRSSSTADRVVVPSRYSARVAGAAYGLDPRRLAVVPEGIDLAPWEALLKKEAPPPPGERRPVILNVARQYPRKNTRALLRALPEVRRSVPEARLRIVGGGPELPRLRRLAGELGVDRGVDFSGSLEKNEAVRREYLTAAVFCLPSKQEGFGIVLLEAMAAGLPIVAARAGAIPEVVGDERSGLLADPSTPGELARALIRVLTDPALAGRLSEGGRRRVRDYERAPMTERFLEAVEGLGARSAGG